MARPAGTPNPVRKHPCPDCHTLVVGRHPQKRCDPCRDTRRKGSQSKYDKKEATRLRQRARTRDAREKLLLAYGSTCACCGETESRFLTFEHKNGCPDNHRRGPDKQGRIPVTTLYKLVAEEGFPDRYEILCWNCNLGRSLNGGICPHVVAA